MEDQGESLAESSSARNVEEVEEVLRKGIESLCIEGREAEEQGAEQAENVAVVLDETIWCNLPEHLMDVIMAWLPVSSLFRFKTVCKRWNTVVSNRSFLELCTKTKSRTPYFLLFADHFHRRVAAIYDAALKSWYMFPFNSFMRCRFPESFLVLAAAGGLLCLEGTGSQSGCMFVSNPISRRWRKLPKMIPMKSPYVVGMVMDEKIKSYKILVAQDGERLLSQMYDSATDRWKLTGVLGKRTAVLAGATYYNGLLYCLTFSPSGLLAFDLKSEQWQEVKLALPNSLACPNLMTYRNRLLLIGGLEALGSLQSVHIWQLHETRPEWTEIAKVPDEIYKKLFASSSGHFICVGHGDFICFHEYYSPDIGMFNIPEKSWQWLPSCSLNENIEARSVLGYAFEPRIEVIP